MTAFEDWVERARAVRIEDEIARRNNIKLRRQGAELVGPCPQCGGDDRFAVNTRKNVFNCRGCGAKGGDAIALAMFLDGGDFKTACTTLAGEPPPKANGKDRTDARKIVVAEYPYHDADGTIVFVVERREFQNPDGTFVVKKDGRRKKAFPQKRPDPDQPGAWLWNVDSIVPVPYRLPELIEAVGNDHVVFVVEGEKCADDLWAIAAPATTNAMGAGEWKAELNKYFANADVVLLPDNDGVGFKHMNDVGAALSGIAKRLRILLLPGLPTKGDVCDWLAAGGSREAFDLLADQAPEWQPLAEPADKPDDGAKAKARADEDTLLDALAKLPKGVEFARQRKKAAKQLGVSADAIDDELAARRDQQVAPLHGHWIVEPWPEPVDGDSLLRDIIQRIRRHVVCSFEGALTIALWIMFSWVHDEVAVHSPILLITSADSECGKTTTLNLISYLAPRAIASVDISKAAPYRSIQLWQPSFIIDEFDNVLASKDEGKAELKSVINSGHTRGQGVIRCITDEHRPELFPTFAPKVIGMIGRKLPPATLSRNIIIEQRRRKKDERVEKFYHKDDSGLADLRRRLFRFAMDNADVLRTANPAMPAEFDNRRADNWHFLLAIADLCSGAEDWGDKARLAAANLEGASDIVSIGVRLLADIKRIRDEDGDDAILSAMLVARLKEDPEAPWAEWNHGKGLTQNSLATLLGGGGGRGRRSRGGFGIQSGDVHLPGGAHGKGYKWSQFEDAWARYLPDEASPPPQGGG